MIKLFGDFQIPYFKDNPLTKNEIIFISFLLAKRKSVSTLEIKNLFFDIRDVDNLFIRRIIKSINSKIKHVGKIVFLNNSKVLLSLNDDITVDLWELEEILKARRNDDNFLERILNLYTGHFLPGIDSAWVNKVRQYYHILIKKIIEDYIDNDGIEYYLIPNLIQIIPDLSIPSYNEEIIFEGVSMDGLF